MAYTVTSLDPSTSSPKSYKLASDSSFTSVSDFNQYDELEKAKLLFGIQGGEKTFTIVVSNMQDPPKEVQTHKDIFAVLNEGQFWFMLTVINRFTDQYSFRVRGYERRGDVRLEVDEMPSSSHYLKYSW